MEINSISVGIGLLIGLTMVFVGLVCLAVFRNRNRYDIPKYLPRDDEFAWAIVMAYPKRLWSLAECDYLVYDNWDLGILRLYPDIEEEYGTKPIFGDVILVPKKWGGTHACVLMKELDNNRFVTIYLGVFNARKQVIYDGRDRTRSQIIP